MGLLWEAGGAYSPGCHPAIGSWRAGSGLTHNSAYGAGAHAARALGDGNQTANGSLSVTDGMPLSTYTAWHPVVRMMSYSWRQLTLDQGRIVGYVLRSTSTWTVYFPPNGAVIRGHV